MAVVLNTDTIEWSPGASDNATYFCGPSHNGQVKRGDDNAAQFFYLSMGSAITFGSGLKVNFSLKLPSIGSAYQTASFNPKCYIDNSGRIYIQGTGTVGGKSITAKHFIAGQVGGECMYIVLDLTNNSNTDITTTPTLIWAEGNLKNFRWEDVGASGNDSATYDSANKYIQLTSSGISNIYVGIRACNTIQHYRAQPAWADINSVYLGGSNNLPDTISTLGNSNYIWVQHGETANPTSIPAGQTQRFVWAVAYKTTQAALQTLMASLSSTPTTDLATDDALYSPTKLQATLPNDSYISRLMNINNVRCHYQARSQTINGYKNAPAGSYTFTFPFARDGYYSVKTLLQTGADAVVSDEYQLFKSLENGDDSQEHEVAQYVNGSGRYTTSGNNGAPGDQDCYQILKAYEYYIATQDSSFLTNEITSLNQIGTYLKTYYDGHSKWNSLFAGHGNSTYLDGAGNVTGGNPMHDPVMCSLVAYAFNRLAELNTLAGNTSQASTWSSFATTLISNFSNLWNNSASWPYFNVKTDGTLYSNKHLAKVDAAIWGILSSAYASLMATELVDTTNWWDSTNKAFYEMPTTDALYSAGSYWYGKGWNLTDFKALETVFRFGSSGQAQTAWSYLSQLALDRLNRRAFLAEHYSDSGVFGFSTGAFIEMLVRGLFGIDAHANYFTISPNTYKLALSSDFSLTNLKMGNKLYNVTVRGTGQYPIVYLNDEPISGNIPYSKAGTDIVVEMSSVASDWKSSNNQDWNTQNANDWETH